MSLHPHCPLSVTGSQLPVSPLGTAYLTVKRFSGHEAINELFEYVLELRTRDEYGNPVGGFAGMDGFISKSVADQGGSPGSNWNLASVIGTQVHLAIECDGKVDQTPFGVDALREVGELLPARVGAFTRYISGIVTRAEHSGVEGRSAVYRLTLRPWLWLLSQTRNYRIFQQRSPIDTISEVLATYPYRVEWRLSESYPTLDYQVQYGESDLDFVLRLCAEYGLNYWFEHTSDAHVLVIADSLSAFVPMESAAYQTLYAYPPNLKLQEEYVHRFDAAHRHTLEQVVLADYLFKTPLAQVSASASDPAPAASGELYAWQQGEFLPAEGERKALLRLQAKRQWAQRCVGAGNLRGMQTGRTFVLANHPSESANRSWLVLRQELSLEEIATESQSARGFSAQTVFWVQPDTLPLVPEPRPKPLAQVQTATVVGPFGREMWTDRFGRVKLRFHWHRADPANEHSSCWVRVAQPWAGQEYGGVHIPRIGQEVLVDFIGGDPDMPVVVGRVHNPAQMPSWELPSQYVLSGVRSKELDGSLNNRWLMDDTTGQVQVQLASDHQDSALSLGHVTRVVGTSGRADFRGRGLELRTDGHGVIRAQSGLLLTTYGRIHGRSHVTDVSETLGLLKGAQAQHKMFAQLAIDHKADERGLDESVQAQLKQQNEEVAGSGALAELSAPHLLASSPAGVALASEQNMQMVARDVALTSGQDVSWSVGQRLWATAGRGVSLFTQSLGLKAFAARGKVQIQAQSDELEVFADQVAKFISAKKSIQIAAKDEVLLTAKGSYIKVNSAGIEQGTPATQIVYAATKSMMGPRSLSYGLPALRFQNWIAIQRFDDDMQPIPNLPFKMTFEDGTVISGNLDNKGYARRDQVPDGSAVVDYKEPPLSPKTSPNESMDSILTRLMGGL